MEGTASIFIGADPVALTRLSEKLPTVEFDRPSIEYEDKKAKGKVAWEALPKDATVKVDLIASRDGREIYRAIYEWTDDEHFRGILLACRDHHGKAEGWNVRPFFIATGDQLGDVDAAIISTRAVPFSVEARLGWMGNGAMWSAFTFLFDEDGSFLFERSSGGRRQNTEYVHYKGNQVEKRWHSTEN